MACVFAPLYRHGQSGAPSHKWSLLWEMEFRRREFEQLYEWDYAQENVMELKIEDVIANPYDQLVRALLFIEVAAENTSLKQVAGHGCE